MITKITSAFLLFFSITTFSQTISIDNTFSIGVGFNSGSQITSIALNPSGDILIGGQFWSFNGINTTSKIIRINSTGVQNFSYPDCDISSAVSIIKQPDNKIIVAGSAGLNADKLQRFNTNASIDNSYGPYGDNGWGFNNSIGKIALQSNGALIVQGTFTSYDSQFMTKGGFTRLNEKLIDIPFRNNLNSNSVIPTNGVNDFLLLSNNKILVLTSAYPTNNLFRLNNDGTLDSSFNANVVGTFCVTEQNDGKIIASRITSGSPITSELIRLNIDGTIDNTFTAFTVQGRINNILIYPTSNKILLSNIYGASSNSLIRLNSNGTLDNSFSIGSGFDNDVTKLIIQPDGKIVAVGFFTSFNGTTKRGLVRLDDSTLSSNSYEIEKIKIYPNPVNNILNIENITNSNYQIYDILGKTVLNGISNQINVSSLEKGVYFLKVTLEEKIITQKFIKE